ncbi:MAG: acetoacetate decarboxylase family protein [Gemmatimonadetes bacterium]|nr:acetoacetate decarboxylase family protein [Gemmatimonadota bacterium]
MRLPGYTYYGFRRCVGAFFEMSTDDARRILPPHLEPLEVQHSRSILAVTAFEFNESEVGEYFEIVLAVVTPPMLEENKPFPKAAFYPFMVGTSTEAARMHAIERWRLPHHMADIGMSMTESADRIEVSVREGDRPVLDLTVTEHEFMPSRSLYNCFTIDLDKDGTGRYKANIYMEAPHSEHEEETGALELHDHPMTSMLTFEEVATYPFREQWYKEGLQTFEPLLRL